MAEQIIYGIPGENQEKGSEPDDTRWEEECYDYGCKAAREASLDRLRVIDERLFHERPKKWKVKRFCQRTLLTRFGKITVTRRLPATEGPHASRHWVTVLRDMTA